MPSPETSLELQSEHIVSSPDYLIRAAEIIPVAARDSERAVPIRSTDLERFILDDPTLAPADRLVWTRLCKLLSALFHHEYLAWLRTLKDLYAPLDPDSDCVALDRGTRHYSEDADEAFLAPFEKALIRANYRLLEMTEVQRAIEAPNERGLNYVPNFELFEHLKVYARGRTDVVRTVRSLRTRFRRRTIRLEAFQRLIVVLKFRPAKNLGPFARTDVCYLRLFKDVPFVDMEMHLPEQGTRVRMRTLDKAQIASPLIVGLPAFALKLLSLSLLSPLALGGILVAPLSAGVNSFFGFQRAKQRHLHHMIRNLYYLTLANNSSVLIHVVESAEEEDYKEALLAYYIMWKGRSTTSAWGESQLDKQVEALLTQLTGKAIDFEVDDAANKLRRLGLVRDDPRHGMVPLSLEAALAHLDQQWDECFRYNEEARTPQGD